MGQFDTEFALPRESMDAILRSARRAGTFLIVPREQCAGAVEALARAGYVRRHLGHVMLTPKGHERLRTTSAAAAG